MDLGPGQGHVDFGGSRGCGHLGLLEAHVHIGSYGALGLSAAGPAKGRHAELGHFELAVFCLRGLLLWGFCLPFEAERGLGRLQVDTGLWKGDVDGGQADVYLGSFDVSFGHFEGGLFQFPASAFGFGTASVSFEVQ
ncbi:Uncharacterised protein [Chlamydia abortus]|nr:Uncharacterised protein [Chlamydia abortus]